jgi:glycosyltransferase involved in cell wall biosynthesis
MYYRFIFSNFVLRAVSRIVVYSRHQIAVFTELLGLPGHQFAHVPYHTTLYDSKFLISQGDYVFAGGDFTRDYPALIEATRNLPYPVIIAARYRNYFQGIDVPSHVTILTATREHFFELMAGAGVVVVPLRGGLLHSGGQQTYLNAMLMGKAVIVADDCGASEYISHNATGILLDPGDTEALRQAIRVLMDECALARSLGERARVSAEAFSPEHFVERVLEIVEQCTEGPNGRSDARRAHMARDGT